MVRVGVFWSGSHSRSDHALGFAEAVFAQPGLPLVGEVVWVVGLVATVFAGVGWAAPGVGDVEVAPDECERYDEREEWTDSVSHCFLSDIVHGTVYD